MGLQTLDSDCSVDGIVAALDREGELPVLIETDPTEEAA
jgi:hypothetical protein